jgi:hypothetical protein
MSNSKRPSLKLACSTQPKMKTIWESTYSRINWRIWFYQCAPVVLASLPVQATRWLKSSFKILLKNSKINRSKRKMIKIQKWLMRKSVPWDSIKCKKIELTLRIQCLSHSRAMDFRAVLNIGHSHGLRIICISSQRLLWWPNIRIISRWSSSQWIHKETDVTNLR